MASHLNNFLNPFAILILVAALSVFVGCASYTIQLVPPAPPGAWGGSANQAGHVFYEPELFFLVTVSAAPASKADAGLVLNATPVYLPNPSKPYRVSTCNFLAKSDFAFNFKDSWQLTSIED